MKNIITLFSIFLLTPFFGQVIIGAGKTTVSSPSVSLEFGTEPKGIILPWTESATAIPATVPGTLIFDTADFKVKVKLASSWKDLTSDSRGQADLTLQTEAIADNTNAKVSIGTPAVPTVPGILVLEDPAKAMVLPTVNTYDQIVNPSPGMMVYCHSTKQVAFFNGTVWTFWKS